MSTTDERIVSLKFDNSGFDAGATKAIGILEKLSSALTFKNGTAGLDAIRKSSSQFNMNGVSTSIGIVSSRFSAFQEFVTGVFRRLGERAADFGMSLARNATVKPIMDGFSEYELQMRSIQTISANTGLSGTKGINTINKSLDELNEYADKTIYNFSEMTRNIGTFTAAGVDLDTSVSSIKGIANLAAVSGSTSQQASTAMYQLSQAIASGTVKLQDWNSVVNAGMGGKVFQEALKRTARAHGIAVDDMISKTGSFRESLHEGWLTTEVLTDTLGQLTISYDEVGDASYKAAYQKLRDANYSKEDAEAILELAKTAEEAATMVRTWTQLWETVGEALGSGWATTFRIIIGDFNQATEVFTYLSNKLSEIINASSEARNAMLGVWASEEVGGRESLFNAIVNIVTAIEKPLGAISKAFDNVFGITGEELAELTRDFGYFTEALIITDDQAESLSEHLTTIFSIVSDAIGIISSISSEFLNVISEVGGYFTPLADKVDGYLKSLLMTETEHTDFVNDLSVLSSVFSGIGYVVSKAAGYFIDFAGSMLVAIDNANVFHHVTKIIKNVSTAINRILRPIRFAFTEVFGLDKSFFDKISGGLGRFLRNIEKLTENLIISGEAEQKLHDRFKDFFEIIHSLGGPLETVGAAIGNFFNNLVSDIDGAGIADAISGLFTDLNFKGLFDKLSAGVGIGGAAVVLKWLKDFFGFISDIKNGKLSDGIGGILDTIRESIESWQNNIKVDTLQKIAISIGIVAASLWVLSRIPADALSNALLALMTSLLALTGTLDMLPKSAKIAGSAVALIALGVAVGLISLSLKLLSTIDTNSLANSLLALMTILLALTGSLNMMPDSGKLLSSSVALIAIGVAVGAISLSLKLLSTINPESLANGLLALMTILLSVVGSLNMMPDSGKLLSSSVALIALGVSVGLLSLSLKMLSSIDADALANSLLALMTILLSVVGSLNMMPDSGKLLASSAALIALGVAVGILSLSLKLLSTIDTDALSNSLLALMTILLSIVGSLHMMPDGGKLLGASAALIAMGVAVGILSLSLKLLSTIDSEALASSLLALMTVLISLVGTITLLSGAAAPMLGVSVAMIGLGIAVGLLALSLKLLSTIPAESLASGLLALMVVFISLAGAMALLSALAAPSLLFTAAMIGLSVAALLLAHALSILIPAITPVVSAMMEIGGNILQGLVNGFMNFLPFLAELPGKVFEFIVGGIKSLLGINSPSTVMAEIGGNIVQGLINGIGDFLGGLSEKAGEIGTTVINGLGNFVGGLAGKAGEGMSGFVGKIASFFGIAESTGAEAGTSAVKGLDSFATSAATKGVNGVVELAKGISSGSGNVNKASKDVSDGAIKSVSGMSKDFKKVANDATKSMANGLSSGTSSVRSAASSLGSAAKSGASGYSLYDTGRYLAEGLANGIAKNAYKAEQAASRMAAAVRRKTEVTAEVKSPSRVFMRIGNYIAEGFAIGIRNGTGDAAKAGEELASVLPDAFSDLLESKTIDIEDILDTDYNPEITPVINATSFNSGIGRLRTALGTSFNDLSIGNLNYAGELSAKISDANELNQQMVDAMSENAIDYNLLGASVANALIQSGVHVEIDGGQLMGYLAGEVASARRMYQ